MRGSTAALRFNAEVSFNDLRNAMQSAGFASERMLGRQGEKR